MVTLAEIFRQHGPAYRQAHRHELLPSHLRVMWCIENCRTAALGGHVYECASCHESIYSYHSCQNRHCNLCQSQKSQEWLEKVQNQMGLPTPYYLVTFTLPSELRDVCSQNQKAMYNLLFRSASEALQELARDPRFVGGQIGMIGVLHTWTRDLRYHPHVHFLVPAGGLDYTQEIWRRSKNHMLVHVKPLKPIFRAKVRDGMKKVGLYAKVDGPVWVKDWSINSKSVGYGEKAFAYMADYLFRVGISNQRILKYERGEVTFRYKDSRTKQQRVVTLPVDAFIRRFLKHVLPKGFVKVRYFGFYAPGAREKLAVVRELLAADAKAKTKAKAMDMVAASLSDVASNPQRLCCPRCKQPMILTAIIEKRNRSPPV